MAYVLMALDGNRDYFETWAPIAVFHTRPSTLRIGRELVTTHESPLGRDAWSNREKPRRIMDYCRLIQVPTVGDAGKCGCCGRNDHALHLGWCVDCIQADRDFWETAARNAGVK